MLSEKIVLEANFTPRRGLIFAESDFEESNVLEIDAAKDKAYGDRNIQLGARERPEHISKRKTENSLEHAQTVTQEPMEEEVSVEVVPEDTEDLKTDN